MNTALASIIGKQNITVPEKTSVIDEFMTANLFKLEGTGYETMFIRKEKGHAFVITSVTEAPYRWDDICTVSCVNQTGEIIEINIVDNVFDAVVAAEKLLEELSK